MLDQARPVYTIGTAAELLGVHPRTLRLYEDGGLIRPARKNNRRLYSAKDLEWVRCVRYLIHQKRLNQEGLRRLLALLPASQAPICGAASSAQAVGRDQKAPCWDRARRAAGENKCFECNVYLTARDHVLTQAEQEEALSQVPELKANATREDPGLTHVPYAGGSSLSG
jgi:MerR family transcriptional regulator, heat shock protein HspR